MKLFKQYIDYIKDNPNQYWFKRKLYGWGWTPVKWQGWVVIAVFVFLLLVSAFSLGKFPTDSEITWFVTKIIFFVILLLLICYKKGEKPGWQWGIKDEKKSEDNF